MKTSAGTSTLWFVAVLLLLSGSGCRSNPPSEEAADAGSMQSGTGEPASPPHVTFQCCREGSGPPLPIVLGGPLPRVNFNGTCSQFQLDVIQCGFDVFSWNSFLALAQSPNGSFGRRDGDNPTIWESWPSSDDIFLPGGAEPPAWNAGDPPPPHRIPEVCKAQHQPGMKVLSQIAKRPDVLESSGEPFQSGPLIDTHGNYARFEILVNQQMYQYIRDNGLYSRSGQTTFTAGQTVDFPCGCAGPETNPNSGQPHCVSGGQDGAVMVKAAWKVLSADDDPTTFHTAKALVVTPRQNGSPETCQVETVGLVGLHIAHKTQPVPQWVWSTFEHVKNAPDAPPHGQSETATGSYNFFQPGCTDCNAVNAPPPQPWNPHVQPVASNGGKSQVERVTPITSATVSMNETVQSGLLGNTVWVNYQLVSTQWPTAASGVVLTGAPAGARSVDGSYCLPLSTTDKSGAPQPPNLANTTLETYIQGNTPQASSCINCHLGATTAEGANNFADFTYLLARAQGGDQ